MRGQWPRLPVAKTYPLFTDGNWIETKDQAPEGIRLVQTGNVGNGEFKDRRDKARFISDETFNRLKCQEVLPGDCLISRLPDPVGRACIIPDTGDKMISAVDCSILRFKATDLLPEFFCYYSQSAEYLAAVEHKCTGATRKRISRKNLGQVQIPLPPLPEQKRIVAILDEAFAGIDAAIANTEKNLANARELFESTLNAVFTRKGEGWVEKTVGELADHCLGKMLDKQKNKGELKPYLRNLNVRWFDFDLTDLLEMKFEAGEEDRYSVRKGDVVICKGDYPGRAAIWPHDEAIYFQKARPVERIRKFYNLDAIISVGYRIQSQVATQFRIWATQRLKEYIVKGFALNDERFKSGNSMNYFTELQERIREIRLSERFFYQKIKDIYTTSINYDPKDEKTLEFFKIVQNKSALEYNKFQETQKRWLIDQYQQLAAKEPDEFPRRHWLYQVESLARQLKDAPLFEQTRRAAFKITPLDPR